MKYGVVPVPGRVFVDGQANGACRSGRAVMPANPELPPPRLCMPAWIASAFSYGTSNGYIPAGDGSTSPTCSRPGPEAAQAQAEVGATYGRRGLDCPEHGVPQLDRRIVLQERGDGAFAIHHGRSRPTVGTTPHTVRHTFAPARSNAALCLRIAQMNTDCAAERTSRTGGPSREEAMKRVSRAMEGLFGDVDTHPLTASGGV